MVTKDTTTAIDNTISSQGNAQRLRKAQSKSTTSKIAYLEKEAKAIDEMDPAELSEFLASMKQEAQEHLQEHGVDIDVSKEIDR